MPLWGLLLIQCGMGLVGGLINALISDNGFLLPVAAETPDHVRIWRPGCVGNAFIGAVAAATSWGLYGPFAAAVVAGAPVPGASVAQTYGLTLAALASAVVVGVGGARWLTNEVDKKLLRSAASVAAGKAADAPRAAQIAASSPAGALMHAAAMP